MDVFAFHLMPYVHLDLDYGRHHKSPWVTYPNANFDPVKGHALYNRFLDELEYAEAVGFDGLCINEHHQNAYGLMPSPVVMASALARRTSRAKIAILGNAFNIRAHPLTLAEEHAMIDCITGGRLISGMVRGIGMEYFSLGANPTLSHERFHEAHDLVVRAWTEPGPFAFEGKHFHFEYVNVWPRPFQKPHPPIWIPSLGSSETIEWASHPSRKYVYVQTFSPYKSVLRFLNMYREAAERHGYTAAPRQIAWCSPVYVSDTDDKARAEAGVHAENFFNKFLKFTRELGMPPGYMTLNSMKTLMRHKSSLKDDHTIDSLIADEVILCGSPDTVRRKLIQYHKDVDYGTLVLMPQFGTLPHDLTMRSLALLGREVLPALKPLGAATAAAAE
ncbi:MAG: LLM class flavin-dependent oxidoreductase [Alphaproteobacteria bacterium]